LGEESIAIAEAKTGFEQDDNGIWYAQFNYQGIPSEQRFLGRLTITSSQVNDIERCVSIATLLGAMQTGEIDCYSSQIASTGCDDGPSDDGPGDDGPGDAGSGDTGSGDTGSGDADDN